MAKDHHGFSTWGLSHLSQSQALTLLPPKEN